MNRRLLASVALVVLLGPTGCGPEPATEGPTQGKGTWVLPAPSAPAGKTTWVTPAPSATDGDAGRLRDRFAVTGRFVGLAEQPEHAEETLDSDGAVCGRPVPLLEQRVVRVARVFVTPTGTAPDEFVEVHQETVVYPDGAVAGEAIRRFFDLLKKCDEDVEEGQVTDGYAAAKLPPAVRVPGRAVTATMTLADGTRFAHRYGCVQGGRVVQCVAVRTRSAPATATWFKKAIVATGDRLAAA